MKSEFGMRNAEKTEKDLGVRCQVSGVRKSNHLTPKPEH